MNWDRVRLWFNVTVAIGLLLTAAFCASTDFRVRLDGWLERFKAFAVPYGQVNHLNRDYTMKGAISFKKEDLVK